MPDPHETATAPYTIEQLLEIISRLRNECPWDRKQTHQTLSSFLLEETYEALETISASRWDQLSDELGDLLLQILLHSQIASESGYFDFAAVVDKIARKMIDRHPHVFGNIPYRSEKEFKDNWEHAKLANQRRDSLLSGIPQALPALLKARRLQEKAATVGFEWEEIGQVLAKCEEEWAEFHEAFNEQNPQKLYEELGDLMFAIVNLCRYLSISAEDALQEANRKFTRRFQYIEKQYNGDPRSMKEASLQELDSHWNDSKKNENI
jgi:MazG family protein